MSRPLRRFFRHGIVPQLIAFEACVRLGSVSRAADELALAQPTVSGLLRKLTEAMGTPLMRARAGRVELTEAGQQVHRMCGELLGVLERFERQQGPP